MLTNIAEIIMLALVWTFGIITLSVPSIFTLADKASILVLNAVIASECGVAAATTGKASTQLSLTTCRHAPHFKHTFVTSVKLITQHGLNIVFQSHAKLSIFKSESRLMHRCLLLGVGRRAATDHSVLPLTIIIHLLRRRDIPFETSTRETKMICILPQWLAITAHYNIIS